MNFVASADAVLEHLLAGASGATLRWEFDGGRVVTFGRGEPEIHVRWSRRASERALSEGTVGFCDGYVDRDWDVVRGSLLDLLNCVVGSRLHQRLKARMPLGVQARLVLAAIDARRTLRRTHSSVRAHYDLGNEFFALWLDESMTYTCGYARQPTDSLEQLQQQKLELVCEKLRLEPGQRLLDLGCGWGSLAIHAARTRGVVATGVNVSRPQLDWMRARVAREGLTDRVHTVESDFRDARGTFDRVVAVGLAEHVGRRGLRSLFRTIADRLDVNGAALVHTIGSINKGGTDPWIERRIFPGSYVPTLSQLARAAESNDLRIVGVENIGYSYGLTLRHWLHRFQVARDRVATMYDERFCRIWEMYLAALVPTFEHLSTCVFQVLVTKGEGPNRAFAFPCAAASDLARDGHRPI